MSKKVLSMVSLYLKHPVQAYREFRRSYRTFIWVLRNWRLYYSTIQSLLNEWYMSDPDTLYCKYCGCKYVTPPIQTEALVIDAWMNAHFDFSDEESRQWHAEDCTHFDIQKLRSGGL